MTATDRSAKIAEFDAHIAILERKVTELKAEEAAVQDRLRRTQGALETVSRIREAEVKLAEGDIKVALLEITLQCHDETGVYE